MEKPAKVAIYGGNGFVGCAIAERLQREAYKVTCISRSGSMPVHLQKCNSSWANEVEWLKGDVALPDNTILSTGDVVITTVGSPPVPTFNQASFDAQFHANGQANIQLLDECAKTSVKRIIVISASIPAFMRTSKFAYYKGKQAVIDHAIRTFNHTETQVDILQPSVIYGSRHTKTGATIPLGFMKYPSKILRKFSQNIAPVSVEDIANTCAQILARKPDKQNMVRIVENPEILDFNRNS